MLGKSTPTLQSGTRIDYELKLHGIPLRWQSEIQDWEPEKKFVDTQVKGPYAYWHHTHAFQKKGKGTLMTDTVLYRLPLGEVGDALGNWYVEKDVSQIFEYREKTIRKLFREKP